MKYLTFALGVSGAAALSLRSPSLQRIRIHSRQAAVIDPDEVPTECQTQCASVLSDTKSCTGNDNACICTAQVARDYQTCVDCISALAAADPSITTIIQAAATVFNSGCSQAGISVPAVTVSGGPAGTGASSGVAAPTAAPTGLSPSNITDSPVPETTFSIPFGGSTVIGGSGITVNMPPTGTGGVSLPVATGTVIGGTNGTNTVSSPLKSPVAAPSGSTLPSVGTGNSAQGTIINTGLPLLVGLIGSVFLL